MTASTPAAPAEALRPVAPAERVAVLDVLRGFALYGVLLANTVMWYSGRAFLPWAEIASRAGPIDVAARSVINVLVDGKAMSLLSFLFGLGFAVQLTRAEAQGREVLPVYLRRLVILIVIGLCHVTFIWWGDILTSYALAGFLLILFRRCSARALIVWALALSIVPQLVTWVPPVAAFLERVLPGPGDQQAWNAQVLAAIRGDDYVHLMGIQLRQALYHGVRALPAYLPWTVGRFLLGYLAGRSLWLHDAPDHLPSFRKLLGWGIGVGVPCVAVTILQRVLIQQGAPLHPGIRIALMIPQEIGLLATAAAYLAALVLLMQRPAWRRRLMVLSPVGQTALTSYVFQSVLCTFVFYGWGLGLVGRVGPALCIPLTLGIFTVQLLASRLWLRYFRFGPLEWLSRSLIYGRPPSMRR